MAERKQVDWESVERDYSAGLLSLREIGDKHGVTEGAIRKKAKKEEWVRDLTAKIAKKTDDLVRKEMVRSEVRSEKTISEKEVIEANAQAIVNVKLGHRTSIKKVKKAYLVGCLAQSITSKQYRLCCGRFMAFLSIYRPYALKTF